MCNKTVDQVYVGQMCGLTGLRMKHGIHFYLTHFLLISKQVPKILSKTSAQQ